MNNKKYNLIRINCENTNLHGGFNKNPDLVIHICGASGSGKTTLGDKLKKEFGDKIIVKDLDNLRNEFINETYDTSKSWGFEDIKYQKYINNFIKNQKKPLILVGLNDNEWGEDKNLYYNLYSQYNFYIEIDDKIITKQKMYSLFN
jgi:hypothetical protein